MCQFYYVKLIRADIITDAESNQILLSTEDIKFLTKANTFTL